MSGSPDIVAGLTLAAYAIPVSLAYAALAGLPPQVGIYGYMFGGLGYAMLGSSRQLAVGPTSAISLMVAGTVTSMAEGDAVRYGQIASLAGFTVGAPCFLRWALHLSVLARVVSDSILVGFKAGAALTTIQWLAGYLKQRSMTMPVRERRWRLCLPRSHLGSASYF